MEEGEIDARWRKGKKGCGNKLVWGSRVTYL